MSRNQGTLDFLRGEGAGSLLHGQLQARHVLDVTGGDSALRRFHTLLQVVERDTGLTHLLRVIKHLVFGHAATQHRDLAHTRDGQQAVAQLKLPYAAHFQRVSRLIAQQGNEHDFTRHGNNGGHFHLHMGGQVLTHGGEALGHNLAGQVDIRIPVEVNPDEGKAAATGTAHLLHPGGAGEGRFQGDGDILLHLLCREATGLGLDSHARHIQLREHVHGRAHDSENAQRSQHQGDDNHREAVAQAESHEFLQHQWSSPSWNLPSAWKWPAFFCWLPSAGSR